MPHQITSEGVEYTVTFDSDGVMVFDPPAPDGMAGRMLRNFADMVITKQFPGLKTETARLSGVGTLDKQFKDDPEYLTGITSNSKRLGYNPKPTDIYLEQLVRPGYKTGDPEAFVPASDVSGHIKRVLRKRVATDRAREKRLRKQKLAPDIVQRYESHYLKEDPSFKKLSKEERKEAIVSKHGPKDS